LVCVVLIAAMAVPAAAQTEIPEEWMGVWDIQVELYDCETDQLLFSFAALDTICAGDPIEEPELEGGTMECTGSADATTFTLQCEGSEEVEPGCIASYVHDQLTIRTGDEYTSVATLTVSYSGDCGGVPDSCQRTEITGTRISDDPEPCGQTPVESWRWDTVRSLYR
jgi:hypothetical protein